MLSLEPRQIVEFEVARNKSPERIQAMVDRAQTSENYYSDGYLGYSELIYPEKYTRNCRDKAYTHNVESINAAYSVLPIGFSEAQPLLLPLN